MNELALSRSPFILSTQEFFAQVDPSRPYETDVEWSNVPVREVELDDVVATQWEVSANRVRYAAEHEDGDYPHLVEHAGRIYLEDGHHRLVNDRMEGRRTIKGRVLSPRQGA